MDTLRDSSGFVFQDDARKAHFPYDADPSSFRALRMVRDTGSGSIFYCDDNSLPDRSYGGIKEWL